MPIITISGPVLGDPRRKFLLLYAREARVPREKVRMRGIKLKIFS